MKIKEDRTRRPMTVTRDGEEFTVTETVKTRRAVVFDLDRAARRAVTSIVTIVALVAMAWSVVSIGALLSQTAPAWVAYAAAGAFDLAWAACMISEWVMRYDDRVTIPRIAGWAFLAVSMTAIATHGALNAGVWIGIIGALISLIAKGLWTVNMLVTARRLSDVSRQIVQQRLSRAGEEFALVSADRELIRIRQETAALRASGSFAAATWEATGLTREALGEEVRKAVLPDPDPDSTPDPIRIPPDRIRSGSVKESVRELFESGTTDPELVVAALPDANPETVKRMVRMMRTAQTGQYL